jgi:peptidoglycan/LPS O-acetylase OafA/YrhL
MIIGSVIALFFVLPSHHPGRLIILAIALVVMTSQWLFGCVITRAEQKLTGNTETIVDPFLGLANIAVNRDTRQAATLAVGTAIAVVMVLVVACDTFIHSVVKVVS